ncbi:MAG TPA: T9SS type A sorting domain-containing protein [Ignavibacteria bacterium]
MKKLIFVILISISFINLNAQWIKLQNIADSRIVDLENDGINIFVCAGKVYKSTNYGEDWSIYFSPQSYNMNSISIIENRLWVNDDYQNYYTTNDGLNWTQVNLHKMVYSFISHNSKIFAGTESWMYYISSDYGISWYQGGYVYDDVMCFLNLGNKLFAGTSSGLYYTTNDGQSWVLTNCPIAAISEIVNNGSKLFAGTQLGIWTSIDSGIYWTQTNFGNTFIRSLEYSGHNIFAGTTYNGIYVSTNDGQNWIQKNEGIGNLTILTLTLINNILFAGTETSGLWKRPLSELVNVSKLESEIPLKFSLFQNSPNPFNPTTKIKFEVPLSKGGRQGVVSLKVFDILGKEVATLVNEQLAPGTYELTFDGSNFASGVYFYQLRSGDFVATKKLILLK